MLLRVWLVYIIPSVEAFHTQVQGEGERAGETLLLTTWGYSVEANEGMWEEGGTAGLPSADSLGFSWHSEHAIGPIMDCHCHFSLPRPDKPHTNHLPLGPASPFGPGWP